jgi:F-box-like
MLDSLPHDIILDILQRGSFQSIFNVAQVNRRIRQLVLHHALPAAVLSGFRYDVSRVRLLQTHTRQKTDFCPTIFTTTINNGLVFAFTTPKIPLHLNFG